MTGKIFGDLDNESLWQIKFDVSRVNTDKSQARSWKIKFGDFLKKLPTIKF